MSNVVSHIVIGTISTIFFPLFFLCAFYFVITTLKIRIKKLDWLFCEKLGWHSRSYNDVHHTKNDPNKFLKFAKCKWCGFEGQIDSQGNLF